MNARRLSSTDRLVAPAVRAGRLLRHGVRRGGSARHGGGPGGGGLPGRDRRERDPPRRSRPLRAAEMKVHPGCAACLLQAETRTLSGPAPSPLPPLERDVHVAVLVETVSSYDGSLPAPPGPRRFPLSPPDPLQPSAHRSAGGCFVERIPDSGFESRYWTLGAFATVFRSAFCSAPPRCGRRARTTSPRSGKRSKS